MDGYELRQILPDRDIFQANGMTIGLCHGHGPADKVLSLVKEEFKKDKVDIIIFGHSHLPMNEIIDNVADENITEDKIENIIIDIEKINNSLKIN